MNLDFSNIKNLKINGIKMEQLFIDGVRVYKTYKNWVRYSTESDGVTIYNGGLGYKDRYRTRSGGAEAYATDSTTTGYIPFKKGDKAYIYPQFIGRNTSNAVNFYDGSFNCLGQITDAGSVYGFCTSAFKTKVVNGVSVLDISAVTVSGVENVAYVRITNVMDMSMDADAVISSGSEMVVTVNEEII